MFFSKNRFSPLPKLFFPESFFSKICFSKIDFFQHWFFQNRFFQKTPDRGRTKHAPTPRPDPDPLDWYVVSMAYHHGPSIVNIGFDAIVQRLCKIAFMDMEIFENAQLASELVSYLTSADSVFLAYTQKSLKVFLSSKDSKSRDRRVKILNIPEHTKGVQVFNFLDQSMRLLYIRADLFEDFRMWTAPGGKKEAVATLRSAAAAIACIRLYDKSLEIKRPDDFVAPEDGDPAERVEYDDQGNPMLDGKNLIIVISAVSYTHLRAHETS